MASENEFVLVLVPADDDPPLLDPEYQKQLADFEQWLHGESLDIRSKRKLLESTGGGGLLGEFFIKIVPTIGSGGLCGLLGAWLQARYGRKVRVKIGETEAEARTVDEVKALLKLASQYQGKRGKEA
jgi:hypothetical protein